MVAQLASCHTSGPEVDQTNWWLLNDDEAVALNLRAEAARAAFPRSLRDWMAAEHGDVWQGTRMQPRPDGDIVVLRFTERANELLLEARKRSPHPELLDAEPAFTRARDQQILAARIVDECEILEAEGIDVRAIEEVPSGIELAVHAADEAAAREVIADRYGHKVQVNYLGTAPSDAGRRWGTPNDSS